MSDFVERYNDYSRKEQINCMAKPCALCSSKATAWGGCYGVSSHQSFKENYNRSIKKYLAGQKFEVPPEVCRSIEHKGPRNSEAALSQLEKMRRNLRVH
ncbi:hypothetical protein GW535_16505 (plasmid) [Piscirickettsia salmonis]|uniref:hypothetical protein n=1 Tax=Piscirickettsia salmonis TaxID=1238 RepID=UPI00137BDBC2|nr:hypothetical protein [Piscirickettsia salmonis]QHS34149.1 hypothetical protein GW535_16505 [Piscirickettsia salmonis]